MENGDDQRSDGDRGFGKPIKSPMSEVFEAKSYLLTKISAAIKDRQLSHMDVSRIVGTGEHEVSRVLNGEVSGYSVSRLGNWLDWIVTPPDHIYSDDYPNYGEDFSNSAVQSIYDAIRRANYLFGRFRLEARGKVHPLRYEALLTRLENISIELGRGGCEAASQAERRLDEFQDDLAVLLGPLLDLKTKAEGHAERDESDEDSQIRLDIESLLSDTAKRLKRLSKRLRRDLAARLSAVEYESFSGRISNVALQFESDLARANGMAELKIREIRADMLARLAELEETAG